jgi:hypothetical protein
MLHNCDFIKKEWPSEEDLKGQCIQTDWLYYSALFLRNQAILGCEIPLITIGNTISYSGHSSGSHYFCSCNESSIKLTYFYFWESLIQKCETFLHILQIICPMMHCHKKYNTLCCNYQEHLNSELVAHNIREFCSTKSWNIFLIYCSRKVFNFNFFLLYALYIYRLLYFS